jgi:hypothetical protein
MKQWLTGPVALTRVECFGPSHRGRKNAADPPGRSPDLRFSEWKLPSQESLPVAYLLPSSALTVTG